jgi:hypothetical protein
LTNKILKHEITDEILKTDKYNRDTYTPMFITALFTIAKLWKQPRCLQMMNGSTKCGINSQWSFFFHKEE